MRRIAAAVLAATALLAFTVTPADAQDIADLPRLGFEISPNQGNVGDLVEGWVDTDDIQEHCLTFQEFWDAEFIGGNPVGSGELLRLLEDIMIVLDPIILGVEPVPEGLTPAEFEQAIMPMGGLFFGLASDPTNIDTLYEELFVLTFVDPVTQEMIGDMGNFDPSTGEGSIIVPELAPALYAVAAACVTFLPDEELVEGGAVIDVVFLLHDWIQANFPDGPPSLLDPGFPDYVIEAAGVWIPALIEPIAVGIDFYCILDSDGFCAVPPEPVGLIDDDVIDGFNGDGDLPLDLDSLSDESTDVAVVDARPAFTG